MKQTYLLLFIIIIVLLGYCLLNTFEGYINLADADNPLLKNFYPIKKNEKLSMLNYSQEWREYPILPLGSYEQKTNNIKYWKNPNNGTCIPPEICNSIYNNKKLSDHPVIAPCGAGIRIGYFLSDY